MLLELFALAGLAARPAPPPPPRVYLGRSNQLRVSAPRIEADIAVDGELNEAPWAEAAVLTGFSQYSPVDGTAAIDSTEVLVWYSPTAIHFGIRAFEPHGTVHATLADRDRIGADDNIQIFLGTFNDGRQAMVFGVNPLGVQLDGTLAERGNQGGGFGGTTIGREATDLSPDFVWQSKGRLTEWGYQVEISIPFKSLRFQSNREQTWGINVIRQIQHSGFEDSWTPARRAAASFLAQSGALTDLTGLRRGLVLDVTPEITSRVSGAATGAGWDYTGGSPDVGGTARWGITNNLTLGATVNPDFSQVESDAGQIGFDPRRALFFAEKRPFFLEGIEQFDTPNTLIYTRAVVQPVGALKITGKALGTNLAALSAVDDRAASANGSHPVVNVVRLQKDVGGQSRIGMAYTDRIDGSDYNRVADLDGRLVFGRIYSIRFQGAASVTRSAGRTVTAPLWAVSAQRTGRTLGLRYTINGIGEEFQARSGFIARPGIVDILADHSITGYGSPDAFLQRITGSVTLNGTWQYDRFIHNRGIQDQKLHFTGNANLRGGWRVQGGLFIESFGYDSALYANYRLEVPAAGGGLDTIPFVGQPTIPNFEGYVQVNTPQFKQFDGFVFVLPGNDENFDEWASGRLLLVQAGLNFRPTDKVRLNFTYFWQQVNRRTDGSLVSRGRIPRLKLEYQMSRPFFVRLVGEYQSVQRDSLRDDSRTGAPILIYNGGSGEYLRPGRVDRNRFRGDVLLAYQPSPGTVLFAGYGSTMEDPRSFRFSGLRRLDDGFFLKLSYLFRL